MDSENNSYSALMVGCGKMGGALLRQWVRSTHVQFTVVDPAAMQLPLNIVTVKELEVLGDQSFDLIIVAIKPQLIDHVLPGYQKHLAADGAVLSMAAGCSAKRLSTIIGTSSIIRIMPNLPAHIGKGVAGIYADDSVSSRHRDVVETIMGLAGRTIWVDTEDGIDRITAVAGSGPGYIFEIARTYVEAAKSLGFSDSEAYGLVLGTISGTIEMAQNSNETLETLRNNVTSKNGTTHAGLQALNADDGLTKKMKSTVDAAYARAVALR